MLNFIDAENVESDLFTQFQHQENITVKTTKLSYQKQFQKHTREAKIKMLNNEME